MSQIKNPYLVELIGVALTEKGISMIIEYIELGDLYSHLKNKNLLSDEAFDWELKLCNNNNRNSSYFLYFFLLLIKNSNFFGYF